MDEFFSMDLPKSNSTNKQKYDKVSSERECIKFLEENYSKKIRQNSLQNAILKINEEDNNKIYVFPKVLF